MSKWSKITFLQIFVLISTLCFAGVFIVIFNKIDENRKDNIENLNLIIELNHVGMIHDCVHHGRTDLCSMINRIEKRSRPELQYHPNHDPNWLRE